MSFPPPYKSTASLVSQGDGGDDVPKRPTRAQLTPHPNKLANQPDYFQGANVETNATGDEPTPAPRPRLQQPPPSILRNSPLRKQWQAEEDRDKPSPSDDLVRKLEDADEDDGEDGRDDDPERARRRPKRNGSSVVSEIIQYGLRHGIGGGLVSGLAGGMGTGPRRRRLLKAPSVASLYESDQQDGEGGEGGWDKGKNREPKPFGAQLDYREKAEIMRERRLGQIVNHVEDYVARQKFIVLLARALLSFGAPSHRIESQLHSAGEILGVHVAFVHFPSLIIVTFLDSDTRTSETRFVRAGGRVALTKLHRVHLVYRDVLHDKIGATEGCDRLRAIIRERPIYGIRIRVLYAFFCASIICVLSFGGSILDMFISGASAALLQYLGLNAASKSTIYANVYEISVSIIVSFVARMLSTLRGNIFCYSAISSAGVVLILPGFTILISALELTSRNILCGSVRMVYAIIYTLFLGFGLTIGSDFYLLINPAARRHLAALNSMGSHNLHGYIINTNTTASLLDLSGNFTFVPTELSEESHIIKGCYRDPNWPWWRQPLPWWTMLFLVPIYSTCSSLQNLQRARSIQLPVMVIFSCLAYAANRAANQFISDRSDIVSASGAFVIGLCGNIYSRVVGGTAFTAMVTGVLFLVPSAIGNGGGLITQNYTSSAERYSSSFELGIRMIQVAIGVTVGLFMSQILVYATGRRKRIAHFAF